MANLLKAPSGHLAKKPSGHLAITPNWPPAELIVSWSGYAVYSITPPIHWFASGSPQSCYPVFNTYNELHSGTFDSDAKIIIDDGPGYYYIFFKRSDYLSPILRFRRVFSSGYIGVYDLYSTTYIFSTTISTVSVSAV